MIDMLKRHEVQLLRRAGHSLPEVAKLAGVSVRSVQRVGREPTVSHVDNGAERMRHRDDAPRSAFERGLREQPIGAEYIAHYLRSPLPPLSTQQELPL